MISTNDKKAAIQIGIGTKPDRIFGAHTIDVLYRQFADPELPYEGKFFGCKVMIGDPEQVLPMAGYGKEPLRKYPYSLSGSFTFWDKGVLQLASILIAKGVALRDYSCHFPVWDGNYPETVLWYNKDKSHGLSLVKRGGDIPDRENVSWAIGGLRIVKSGMKTRRSYNEDKEGFKGKFADVHRTTAHCGIGFDKYGNALGIYHNRCSLDNFKDRCISMGMVDGISIDGGHISAINAGDMRANTSQKQGYLISFKGGEYAKG